MEKETIAVMMTAYNEKEEWFHQAVDSVLNQTYPKIHLYILLDNPDNEVLWQIMQEYAVSDLRVSIYKNDKNLGLVASLNKLLDIVTENMVARMDADDICCPDRLEKELEFLKRNQLDFVMSGIDFIRADEIEQGPDVPELLPELFAESEKYGNHATHPTWLLKSRVYHQLEGYRQIHYCEDLDFVLRAIQAGYRLGRMQEVLLHYRMRETGISNSYAYEQYEKATYLHQKFKIGDKVKNLTPEELNQCCDFSDEKLKRDFQKTKGQIDAFAAQLYQGKYVNCALQALKGIIGSKLYRKIFFKTLKNNRNMTKIYRKARAK